MLLLAVKAMLSFIVFRSTAAFRRPFWLDPSAGGEKLLPTLVAAKVVRLAITFGV